MISKIISIICHEHNWVYFTERLKNTSVLDDDIRVSVFQCTECGKEMEVENDR